MARLPVVVVGGGPAGLSATAALKTAGVDAIVLDRDARVGASWLRRYERLRLHTVRRYSGLAHRPMPPSYPKYVPKDAYARYLREYAEYFALDVEHGCTVRRVSIADSYRDGRPRYTVKTDGAIREADVVVIATGMYGRPIVPAVAGAQRYLGLCLHSSQYASGAEFAGRRVLVVGLGNTGAEIAADLVERGAAAVAVAVRTPPPVVPRDVFLVPVQLFGMALSDLPSALSDRVAAAIARVAIGDLTRYGLPAAQWLPFSAKRIPVIDVGFTRQLRAGKIAIRPALAEFCEDGVVYDGGRTEAFDAVVYATGYGTGLDELLGVADVLDAEGLPRQESPEAHPGLHFVGFVKSHRGLLLEIDRASRRLARALSHEAVVARPRTTLLAL